MFDIQDFYDLDPSKRFEAIFSAIEIEPIVFAVAKKSTFGAPTELNYAAMIYALVARIHEGIPPIKLLVKRLKNDFLFRLDCGFLFSDQTSSGASFSRLIGRLGDSQILEEERDSVVLQAIEEGFILDDTVAIDATHFEARDRSVAQEKKAKSEPKKRGRKPKAEKEQWDKEKQEKNLRKLFTKKLLLTNLMSHS